MNHSGRAPLTEIDVLPLFTESNCLQLAIELCEQIIKVTACLQEEETAVFHKRKKMNKRPKPLLSMTSMMQTSRSFRLRVKDTKQDVEVSMEKQKIVWAPNSSNEHFQQPCENWTDEM